MSPDWVPAAPEGGLPELFDRCRGAARAWSRCSVLAASGTPHDSLIGTQRDDRWVVAIAADDGRPCSA